MPTIYDNINPNTTLLDGLKEALKVARRADFCVGYFNLRGWQSIAAEIEAIPPQPDMPACRLIVGKSVDDAQTIRNYYNHVKTETTNKIVHERQKQFAESLMRQLASGIPTASDETGLNRLARHIEEFEYLTTDPDGVLKLFDQLIMVTSPLLFHVITWTGLPTMIIRIG